jgi:hypothetical protein
VFPGLAFSEKMSGQYWRLDAPTEVLAIALTVNARAPDLAELARERTFPVTGVIDAQGLASERPLLGTVAFRFIQQGRVHYRLAFEGDDGRRYELAGLKEWSPLAPFESLTRVAASLCDVSHASDASDASPEEVARATLAFDLRKGGWDWLRSVRLSF